MTEPCRIEALHWPAAAGQIATSPPRLLRRALLVPPPRLRERGGHLSMGVVEAEGNLAPEAVSASHRRSSHAYAPSPEDVDTMRENAVRIPGRWLFGGLASQHFGHQLTRCLGRLYALPLAQRSRMFRGIIFVPLDRRARPRSEQQLLARIIGGLGLEVPVRQVIHPTIVQQLVVAPDLYGESAHGLAHPDYVDAMRGVLPGEFAAPHPGRKIYVTRSKLDPQLGRVLCEPILEQNLAAEGYEIVVPETLPVADQIRLYREASHIVTTDGSQVHLMAFARVPGQRIAVIARRRERPVLMVNHLASFNHGLDDGPAPLLLDAVTAEWWPPVRADNLSASEIDFPALAVALAQNGFIDKPQNWRIPDAADLRASKALAETEWRYLTTAERQQFLRGRS